jgi:hypothetical protein
MKHSLPLLLLFLCSAAMAESGSYHVEVIVFRNLAEMAEADEVDELQSFSHLPSLEEIVPPVELPDQLVEEPVAVPSEEQAEDLLEPIRDDLPDELRVIIQKGVQMDGVWRRLRSSKNYRPLLYSAWEQNRVDYYPPMRMHDQVVINTQLRPPTHIMVADLSEGDPLAAYRSTFYQLDGSVQLRRSRFLHLFLDLEYREQNPRLSAEQAFFAVSAKQAEDENDTAYRVFALKQNRQIRTRQVQYFDTPYFGVLVLVSPVNAE